MADRSRQWSGWRPSCHGSSYPSLTDAFRPHLTQALVCEGLQKIRAQFSSIDHVGPVWVADFMDVSNPEERAILQRRAYETVTRWLDALDIGPWGG